VYDDEPLITDEIEISSATSVNEIPKGDDIPELHNAWFPTDVLDISLLVAALISGAAGAPLFAFSHDELVAADARWNENNHNNSASLSGTFPVSLGVAVVSSYSTCLALWSIMAFVVARMFLSTGTMEKVASSEGRQIIVRCMNPLAASGFVALATATVGFAPSFWYAGFVVFPFEIANSRAFFWAGGAYMLATAFLVVGSLALVWKVRALGKIDG
jgi:hypothetical protein